MGTGDDSKPQRATRRFDSEQLAKLTRDAGVEPDEPASAEPPRAATAAPDAPDAPHPATSRTSTPRTSTVHDPLTMALLAEVTRTSRTIELDPDKLDEARAAVDEDSASPVHPHIKRR